ncbi:hypothetical protein VTL71DRAFT_16100 [Oculimacula yallundae]|uniref:Uncharacterized protein n=1 Tax=Oculimacula yallundae TaxID=86028 RepID=A0ABR4CDI2_9HELO
MSEEHYSVMFMNGQTEIKHFASALVDIRALDCAWQVGTKQATEIYNIIIYNAITTVTYSALLRRDSPTDDSNLNIEVTFRLSQDGVMLAKHMADELLGLLMTCFKRYRGMVQMAGKKRRCQDVHFTWLPVRSSPVACMRTLDQQLWDAN